jgi:hypothetical protein
MKKPSCEIWRLCPFKEAFFLDPSLFNISISQIYCYFTEKCHQLSFQDNQFQLSLYTDL